MRYSTFCIFAIVGLALGGCGQNRNPDEAALAALKDAHGVPYINAETVKIDEVDANKTLSIATPYRGVIILHTQYFFKTGSHPDGNGPYPSGKVRIIYDWQDGQWIVKSMEGVGDWRIAPKEFEQTIAELVGLHKKSRR